MSVRTVHAVVSGRVQGVGYRAFAAAKARARGLRGHVRNRADGAVEVVVSGPPEAVGAFLDALRVGPAHARVDALAVEERPADAIAGDFIAGDFEVRYA